jgi:lipid II isoglutaminyl synthase (glutamine-hydrolysing)
MTRLIVIVFVFYTKLIRFLSKTLKKGSGTSFAGIYFEKHYPSILSYYNHKYQEVILITGTNGKTTTRSILTNIYKGAGYKVVTNIGGANIFRGLITALFLDCNIFAQPKSEIAILEVEEATMPIFTKFIESNKIVFTNIFRDQLDVYGELNQTLDYFRAAIKNNPNAEIIINGDDHKLLEILDDLKNKDVISYQVVGKNKPNFEKAKSNKYTFNSSFTTKNLELMENQTSLDIINQKKTYLKIDNFSLSGVYNVYNLVASIACCRNIPKSKILIGIKNLKPAFGRGEIVKVKNNTHKIFLVKNPAGFDQTLSMLEATTKNQKLNLAILINDNIADGRDVSWLWDINFDLLPKNKIGKIFTSGSRGLDMLLRLEYDNFNVKLVNNYPTLNQFVNYLVNQNQDFVILTTYTALLELREKLGKITKLPDISDTGN